MRRREFVAVQSRLTNIYAVLKQLVQQSETDPEVRLAELQRQRDGIDAEMQRIRDGNIRVMTGPEALDHPQQLPTHGPAVRLEQELISWDWATGRIS